MDETRQVIRNIWGASSFHCYTCKKRFFPESRLLHELGRICAFEESYCGYCNHACNVIAAAEATVRYVSVLHNARRTCCMGFTQCLSANIVTKECATTVGNRCASCGWVQAKAASTYYGAAKPVILTFAFNPVSLAQTFVRFTIVWLPVRSATYETVAPADKASAAKREPRRAFATMTMTR